MKLRIIKHSILEFPQKQACVEERKEGMNVKRQEGKGKFI